MSTNRPLQRDRRADPYPWTWEIPVGAIIAAALLLILGVHVGRGLAWLLSGHGWAWPGQLDLITTLPAVLGGDAHAGLAETTAGGPGAGWVRVWVIVTELVIVVLLGVATWYGLGRWGPGRVHGVATKPETQQTLGVGRLRRIKAVVRPDLYGKERE
ncbi:hypothetical protein [Ornithinimicrobium murale]|uniref:hypothetical protein n=1 Tax=Ornithinimicrobium murale TaxID=1050153 RepID=UPI000E0D47E9|nr:hypothetical protein [Ornithinimicrobium murale]